MISMSEDQPSLAHALPTVNPVSQTYIRVECLLNNYASQNKIPEYNDCFINLSILMAKECLREHFGTRTLPLNDSRICTKLIQAQLEAEAEALACPTMGQAYYP